MKRRSAGTGKVKREVEMSVADAIQEAVPRMLLSRREAAAVLGMSLRHF